MRSRARLDVSAFASSALFGRALLGAFALASWVGCGGLSEPAAAGDSPASRDGASETPDGARAEAPTPGEVSPGGADSGAPDALPHVGNLTCSAQGKALLGGSLFIGGNASWMWSQDHYVELLGHGIQASEIWWPTLLPGSDGVIYATGAPLESFFLPRTGGQATKLSEAPMRPLAGTTARGLLYDDAKTLYLRTSGSAASSFGVLPVAPREPEGHDAGTPATATAVDETAFWLGDDDAVYETSLTTGLSTTFAPAAASPMPIRALGADLSVVGWIRGDEVVMRPRTNGAPEIVVDVGAAGSPHLLTVRDSAAYAVSGIRVLRIDTTGQASTVLQLPRVITSIVPTLVGFTVLDVSGAVYVCTE